MIYNNNNKKKKKKKRVNVLTKWYSLQEMLIITRTLMIITKEYMTIRQIRRQSKYIFLHTNCILVMSIQLSPYHPFGKYYHQFSHKICKNNIHSATFRKGISAVKKRGYKRKKQITHEPNKT